MAYDIEPVLTDQGGDEHHPAFAVLTVHNVTSTPGAVLFQSDLRHNHTIKLTLCTATRERHLAQDWVHPGDELFEVQMSLSQWAAMVASAGNGQGTPVTLTRIENKAVPAIPYQPRIAESLAETKGSVSELLAKIKAAMDALNELEDAKAGIRERRAARSHLTHLIANAPSNAHYTMQSLAEHAENLVAGAKADIEVAVAEAAARHGVHKTLSLGFGEPDLDDRPAEFNPAPIYTAHSHTEVPGS